MSSSADRYRPVLDQVASFLDRPDRLLIPEPDARAFLDRALDLIGRLRAADDRLVIGLVGGTGVGKSTLINALAEKEISAASDLRPTTSRLVLYRHEDNDFSLDAGEAAHLHRARPLERVTLADFPDFDSIEQDHRLFLSRLFPRLDLLLWVVDPAKYADRSFYDWLALAPQARVNAVFIFNKIDELECRYGPRTEAVIAETTKDLEEKLVRFAGLSDPVILPLSARDALEHPGTGGGEGFRTLRNRLNELAEEKLRRAIKEMNIEAMTRGLVRQTVQTADLPSARVLVRKLVDSADRFRAVAGRLAQVEAGGLMGPAGRPIGRSLAARAKDEAPFPLDFFLFIGRQAAALFGRDGAPDESGGSVPFPPPEALSRSLGAWRAETRSLLQPVTLPPLAGPPTALIPAETGALALAAAGGLDDQRRQAEDQVRRAVRWRIRHHLLPALVLAYPFLPMILSLLGRLVGEGNALDSGVRVTMAWGDLWVALEAGLGLYLVQTFFFLYRIEKAATLARAQLAEAWGKKLEEWIGQEAIGPLEAWAHRLEEEIRTLDSWPK